MLAKIFSKVTKNYILNKVWLENEQSTIRSEQFFALDINILIKCSVLEFYAKYAENVTIQAAVQNSIALQGTASQTLQILCHGQRVDSKRFQEKPSIQ